MLLAALCVTVVSHAQVAGLLGTVTDESGEPIIGASVVEKGNPQNGTITNIDGQFSLKVEAGTALTISSVGYITQDVAAANHMTVVLQEDNKALDEVVVIGYGVQKKSVVTAAISKVDGDDLNLTRPSRIEDALKGKVSGVQLSAKKGEPVTCVRAGTVMYTGNYRGYGQVVFVQSKANYIYAYTGLESVSVRKGDYVVFGDSLGTAGMDSIKGTSQIAFMVFYKSDAVDPAKAPRG
jgi:murein DD-endopeptidase MepM/ murein hydrolase activator NlpD